MNFRTSTVIQIGFQFAALAAFVSLVGGCKPEPAVFEPNLVFVKRMEMESGEKLENPKQDIDDILSDLFGSPDQPLWPTASEDLASLVDIEKLQRAAGPVSSDEKDVHFGLYRKHCVLCHGQNGNGRGPTARLLNPYPRNFRLGKFKFKSTARGVKPLRSDLKRTLELGIVGTSMPAFPTVSDADLEALVDYVIYLSVRGEVERKLITTAAFELDYSDGDELSKQDALEIFEAVAKAWSTAQSPSITEPPPGQVIYGSGSDPQLLLDSVARGKDLFHQNEIGCVLCHGEGGQGGKVNRDYDDWTKDWTILAGIDPENRNDIQPFLDLGAFKPRRLAPRNLTAGVLRGGSRPIDVYYRIIHGIEGSPMPSTMLKSNNPQGLEESEVWDLVNYVLSLGDNS